MEDQNDRKSKISIDTPLVLRSSRKLNKSPNSLARANFMPSKSGLLNQLFQVPQRSFKTDSKNSVIVFGYPEKFKHIVLEKFSKIGAIEEIKPGGGNWMTIDYADYSSVCKALAYSSQFIADNIIIGVKLPALQEVSRDKAVISSPSQEHYTHTQYLKKEPRYKAEFLEKFKTYVLNIDD